MKVDTDDICLMQVDSEDICVLKVVCIEGC
jgi:hypothetical protein